MPMTALASERHPSHVATARFDDLPGWVFAVEERSAGVYSVRAVDDSGRSIQVSGTDAEQLLERCRLDAQRIVEDASRTSRGELLRLVNFLMSGGGTEAEQDKALRDLESRVEHPRISALIFWPQSEGFDHELTAEEVVDVAVSYRPIEG